MLEEDALSFMAESFCFAAALQLLSRGIYQVHGCAYVAARGQGVLIHSVCSRWSVLGRLLACMGSKAGQTAVWGCPSLPLGQRVALVAHAAS